MATPSTTDTMTTVESGNPPQAAAKIEEENWSSTSNDGTQGVSGQLEEGKQSPVRPAVTTETTEPTSSSDVKYKSDEGLKMKFLGGFTAKKRTNPPSIAVQLKPQVHVC